MTGLVIDGLIRALRKPTNTARNEAEVKRLKEFLDSSEAPFSEGFRKRVNGFLDSSLPNERPEDILEDWNARGILGIEQGDVSAWKKIRHPTAHGSLVDTVNKDKLQIHVDRVYRCVNLINKLTLQAMGFVGDFIDYSKTGWPRVTFPHAAPSDLTTTAQA